MGDGQTALLHCCRSGDGQTALLSIVADRPIRSSSTLIACIKMPRIDLF
jgi:hypothetical protein